VAREAHRAAHYLFGLLILLLLLCIGAAWRLAQGPVEVPQLARIMEAEANVPGGAARLAIGRVTIAWEGLRGDGLTPLELRLSGMRVLGEDGAVRVEMPDSAVSLSVPWLLRGQLAPRRIELQQPVLRLRRDEAGRLSIQLGATEAPEEVPAGVTRFEDLLAEMLHAPNDASPLGALAALSIAGGRVSVEDAALGIVWALEDTNIELRRLPGGGISGRGAATMRLGEARVPVATSLEAAGDPARITLRAALPELRPAALATLAPAFAPLARLDAPARLDLSARLAADGTLLEAGATIGARAGALDLGEARRIPIAGLDAAAEWRPGVLRVTRAALRLEGPGTPLVAARAEAQLRDGRWRAGGEATLDAAPLAELARWWPEGLGGGERDWLTSNITAGVARNGRWTAEAEAAADLTGFSLASLAGTLDVTDATVHWLRPVPPVEGVQGRIAFSPTEVTAHVAAARQSGTQVRAREATLRFLFAPGTVPSADMQIGLAGPVPEVLGVLQHPRLRLFDRRPLPLKDPQGTAEGRLSLGFPLLNDLPAEALRVRAQARLRDVRLADLLLGRNLERGQFELSVDNAGLRVTGTAMLAEIQARLGVEMDFRGGPATQVVMRETVQARADARQLAALGLANEEVVRGPVGLDIRSERRRNGAGRVNVRADLREATLALDLVNWGKPPGQNAGADAVLRLAGENLEAIESFRIEAPALLLRGNATFGRGARLDRVTLAEAQVEGSRLTGEARPPAEPGAPWRITMRGPVLDLRRAFGDAPAGTQTPGEPGPAVAVEGRFDRVLLGPGRELGAVEALVLVDGRGVVRDGRVRGRAGPRGPFEATIAPEGAGRALRLVAEDAGALLHAFDVLRHLEGGRLNVTAAYANNGRGAPLSGTAEMSDFVVHNAPAFAKLLQAMTLYGLVEAVSGPGLNFARLVAPFTLSPEALALENARAFSASLGLTARGTLDRRRQRIAMEGTIVPAYIFNSLLGNIPILGRLFSPEAGGGVFAATFRLQGALDDPQVSVNPLAALTPGFLRGLFGLGQGPAQ